MTSTVSFFTVPNTKLEQLCEAARPDPAGDLLDEYLELEAHRWRPFCHSSFVLSSIEWYLRDRGQVDLEPHQRSGLARELADGGRATYTFSHEESQRLLARLLDLPQDAETIWAFLQTHGFAASQQPWAGSMAEGLSILLEWLASVTRSTTGVLIMSY